MKQNHDIMAHLCTHRWYFGLTYLVCIVSSLKVEMPIQPEKHDIHYRPQNRYDNNDRSTQASDTLWKETGHAFLEWPGNITELDPSLPLIAWKETRAKLVRSACERKLGMEVAAYAQKYLHFTWGGNRLTKWYCDPLRIPIKLLPTATTKPKTTIAAVDFGFSDDALLVVLEGGVIIRVENFQSVYRNTKTEPQGELRFGVSEGLTSVVDRIVTQACCSFGHPYCFYGQSVVAYSVQPGHGRIFISKDGGRHFKEVIMEPEPPLRKHIRAILYYGSHESILVHMSDGKLLETAIYDPGNAGNWTLNSTMKTNIALRGDVQAQILGNAMSYLLWDLCRVWYADEYLADLRPAILYMHSMACRVTKRQGKAPHNCSHHVITDKACIFGRNSILSIGEGRKLALLASNNMLFYGIDSNEERFRLISLATDMTLLKKFKRDSVTPGFDRNNRPQLFYPPRYLRFPYPEVIDESYERRLAMKIIGKTLFPSDFMRAFYAEAVAKLYPSLGLERCETSTLSVNGSVSQKPKSFSVKPKDTLVLTITFYSKSRRLDQLHDSRDWKFMRVEMQVDRRSAISRDKFWFKYVIRISYDLPELEPVIPKAVKIIFYTSRKLRCLNQPEALVSMLIVADSEGKNAESVSNQTRTATEKKNQSPSHIVELTCNHSHATDFLIKTKAFGATVTYLILWFSTMHQLVIKKFTRK